MQVGSANGIAAVSGHKGLNCAFVPKIIGKTAAHLPAEVDSPMRAPGCHWEFWNGAIGLSTSLHVFEAGDEVGAASD